MLPIVHLNGYKIANPTVLARMDGDELRDLFIGLGYEPFFVEGHEPIPMHRAMADTLDTAFDRMGRSSGTREREAAGLSVRAGR